MSQIGSCMIAFVKSYMVLECVQCEQFSVLCLILRRQCNVVLEEINVNPCSRDRDIEGDTLAIALVTLFIIARAGIFVD